MGTEILKPTWSTWDDFDAEYIPWRKSYEASPLAAGQFFKGGEILPDGSTILESPNFETITVDFEGDTSTITLVEGEIPRSRVDMKNLYSFDHKTDTRSDIKGTRARKTKFYKEYIQDMEDAESRDPEETIWIDTFKRLRPQLEDAD